MAKATIVSILPYALNETKPGLYPGNFFMEGCKVGEVRTHIVEETKSYVYLDDARGSLAVDLMPDKVAKAVVDDHINASLGIKENAKPGIFWLDGAHTPESVKKLDIFKEKTKLQENWFEALVKLADDEWSKYRQHRSISDLQRHAAKALGLTREWLVDVHEEGVRKCPACQSIVSNNAIICMNCKCILNADLAKAFKFATAV